MSKKERPGCLTSLLRRCCSTVFLAGLVILALGAYYAFVKAGVPYQDPTPEMQLSYAINEGIGRSQMIVGGIMAAAGGVLRLLVGRGSKK